ncbi:MAG: GrpB family protein [Candidatus Nanopelagicales bacterium]
MTGDGSSARQSSLSAVPTMVDAGLGQDARLTLERTTEAWLAVGSDLRDHVAAVLAGTAVAVEHVGSSSVLDLLAKPIVDLAVGVASDSPVEPVIEALTADGWIYRGDAGEEGGHVLVLESEPGVRVAHLHVVPYAGDQWVRYLALREVLRGSPQARQEYEDVKLRLVAEVGGDRVAYTEGKTDVVLELLERAPER